MTGLFTKNGNAAKISIRIDMGNASATLSHDYRLSPLPELKVESDGTEKTYRHEKMAQGATLTLQELNLPEVRLTAFMYALAFPIGNRDVSLKRTLTEEQTEKALHLISAVLA